MSDTVIVKTSELQGAALDWAVATAEGLDIVVHAANVTRYDKRDGIHCSSYGCTYGPGSLSDDAPEYSPSTDWSVGGPLIEKWRLDFAYVDDDDDNIQALPTIGSGVGFGSTHLVAAMRAIVASELGNTISVPAELTPTR